MRDSMANLPELEETCSRSFELGAMPVFHYVEFSREQAIKVLEEASECTEAAKKAIKDDSLDVSVFYYDMLSEAADVCQALCNLLFAAGVSPEEWKAELEACIKRNRLRGRF